MIMYIYIYDYVYIYIYIHIHRYIDTFFPDNLEIDQQTPAIPLFHRTGS